MTMETQPFEDVSAIKKMVIFHCHVSFRGKIHHFSQTLGLNLIEIQERRDLVPGQLGMDDRDLDLCHDDPIALALLPCPPGKIGQDDHQCSGASVDGSEIRRSAVEVGSLSHY